MKFRSFSLFSIAISAFLFGLNAPNLSAQSQNNFISTDAKQVTAPANNIDGNQASNSRANKAGFPESADPQMVKTYSEQQLNGLLDRMTSQYSKDAVLFNNVGAAYFHLEIYDKAETAIRKAVVLSNHPAFLTNLSAVYDAQGKMNEAISTAQRAVTQAPKFVRARTELCGLLIVSRRDADAILCYDEMSKITSLEPMDQTYYAVALVHSKSYDKAIGILAPLTKSEQATSLMFNILGNAYYMKKRYGQAAEAFKRAVEIAPDSAMLRYNLAMSLTASNDREGALSQYNLMKKADPALADKLYKDLYRGKILFVDEQTASKHPKK